MERYERYKDSGVKWIGEIPEHWGMYKLKYLFKLNKNKNIGNKCNTILSLSYGKIKIKKDLNEGLTPESYESYQLLSTGDIVIRSTDLQNDHTSLRTGLVKNEGAITSAYIGLKNLDKNLYDSRFYHYFLHDWDITKAIYNQGKGLRQSLNWDDIKNMLMPVLDISEQTAIANFLDSVTSKIDEAISQQQKMIDLLNERKQIIIQNTVTKGLDPNVKMKESGVEWIGEIPGHWGMYKLKYLFKLNKNKNIGNKCNTILSLSYGKIKIKKDLNEGLTPESYESYQLLSTGDIVIRSTDLQNDHTSLRTGLVKNEGAITSAYIGLKNLDKNLYDSRFYHYFLHDWDITKAIYNQGKGLRQSLNWDDIKNMLMPVLDISEQTAIANILDSVTSKIDSSISQCNKMISLLQERKQIIINDVVTGKVKVV